MNIEQAKKTTISIFKDQPTLAICWVGGSGIGKTETAQTLAEPLGLKWVYAPIRSEDAMGTNLPNAERTQMDFVPHTRLAQGFNTPCLLYFDEWNRIDRYARAAMLEVVGERTLGGRPLHPKTCILLTVNGEGDHGGVSYDVTEVDQAAKTRCIPIPVHADAALSAQWAAGKGFVAMANWLQKHPEKLNEELVWHLPKPDPRILTKLNQLLLVEGIPAALNNEIMDFVLKPEYAKPFYKSQNLESTLLRHTQGPATLSTIRELFL